MKYYAGVGSRETPEDILTYMTYTAWLLEQSGYILRSGGAKGADKAFENGVMCPGNFHKQIITWHHSTVEAENIASKIHPAWHLCNDTSRKLHGRNVLIVLGQQLDEPVKFVVAWTKNGELIGGTRTPIVLAKMYKIPVYNLAIEAQMDEFTDFLMALKQPKTNELMVD